MGVGDLRRCRHHLRLPGVVRRGRARADAARDPEPRGVRRRVHGAGLRLRPARHGPLPQRRSRLGWAGVGGSAAPGAAGAERRRAPVAADRFLPPPAHDPPLRVAVPVVGGRLLRRARELVRGACPRPLGRALAPLPPRVHPLLRARQRVPVPDRQPVPRLHRDARLPRRGLDRRSRAPEPLDHAVPDLPRDPGALACRRTQRRPLRRELLRLVLRARHREDADGLPQRRGDRDPLPGPDERVLVRRDGHVPARESRPADASARARPHRTARRSSTGPGPTRADPQLELPFPPEPGPEVAV